LFCELVRATIAKGNKVFILSHREELVQQISDTLTAVGVPHSFVAAGREYDPKAMAWVCGIMTLNRRIAKGKALTPPNFIIIDEGHHATATTWGTALSHFRVVRLGVTATPQRLDGNPLGDVFDDLVVGPTAGDLIKARRLSAYAIVAPPAPDLTALRVDASGDFSRASLSKAICKPVITGDAVAQYQKWAHGKRAVAFCVHIQHAKDVTAAFTAAGYRWATIDGTMDRGARKEMVSMFRQGFLDGLSSVDLISEGFDLPAIECAIMLRATKSLGLWIQQFGRALRVYPGKEIAIILDHVGGTESHKWLPEVAMQWSLDGKVKKPGDDDSGPSVRRCVNPACYRAQFTTAAVCQYCGTPFNSGLDIGPREVKHVAGELVPMTAEDLERIQRSRRVEQGRAESFEDLVELGRKRGMKNPVMWAHHVWLARMDKMHAQALAMNEAMKQGALV
jgi:superfamily II DNA or RNA helicase